MATKTIQLLGASGHGKVIYEILMLTDCFVLNVFDEDLSQAIDLFKTLDPSQIDVNSPLILSIGSNAIRKKLAAQFSRFATAIHPRATIAKSSTVGEGTVVMAGATINPSTTIGRHCIINTNASVDHDCVVEDFVHLSPNATLCGGISVGEGTHIGAGAVVIPGVQIGRWCTIGAGTVVIKNIPDGCTVVGNPGRIIKQKENNA